jgi:retron-type reverse transcriptase
VWSLSCALLRKSTSAEVLPGFLRDLASVDQRLLLSALSDELSCGAFARLCADWPGPLTGAVGERLRAILAVPTGRPAWLALLQRLRKARQPVPARLTELARSGGIDVLRAAFRAYPDAFAESGPLLFALRPLLRFAFAHPRVAHFLEAEVPRATLVAQLGWVRETWAHAPSVSAALELALCFSLRDARFLCQLARRARPVPRGERGRTFDDLYTTFARPKKSGGERAITAPQRRLKRLQRRLLANGFAHVELHESAHGFRTGASIHTNALPHVGKALVVNLDIKGFFPSTGHPLILRACRHLASGRLSVRALMLLADLCSYGGALPTGAPTSPAIGNIVLFGVDRVLARAAARHGAAYTRYADDLTFSGPGEVHRLIPFVKRVLGELGYEVERRKINLFRRGRRQMVTGLSVNDKVNWPRHRRRRLRAAVEHRRRGQAPTWQGEPLSDDRLRGLIAFLNQTAPEEAARLRARLPELYPLKGAGA